MMSHLLEVGVGWTEGSMYEEGEESVESVHQKGYDVGCMAEVGCMVEVGYMTEVGCMTEVG